MDHQLWNEGFSLAEGVVSRTSDMDGHQMGPGGASMAPAGVACGPT
jgi:hypothetical protein